MKHLPQLADTQRYCYEIKTIKSTTNRLAKAGLRTKYIKFKDVLNLPYSNIVTIITIIGYIWVLWDPITTTYTKQ